MGGSEGARLGSCCGLPVSAVFDGAGLVRAAWSSCTGQCLQLARSGPHELVSRQRHSPAQTRLKMVRVDAGLSTWLQQCCPWRANSHRLESHFSSSLHRQCCWSQVVRHAPMQSHVRLLTAMMCGGACVVHACNFLACFTTLFLGICRQPQACITQGPSKLSVPPVLLCWTAMWPAHQLLRPTSGKLQLAPCAAALCCSDQASTIMHSCYWEAAAVCHSETP